MAARWRVVTFAGSASACHACQKTPCVLAPPVAAPAYQCVTEMVPYTVYKQRKRIEFETVTETIMVKVADTTYVERQRVVCKPVWDTNYVQREVNICRPVPETTVVNQQYTVCKPVSTTRQVTEYLHAADDHPGHGPRGARSAATAARPSPPAAARPSPRRPTRRSPWSGTWSRPKWSAEVPTRQVPVTTTHLVREPKVETVPVRTCRIVQESSPTASRSRPSTASPRPITRQIPTRSARPSPRPATGRSRGWSPSSTPRRLPPPRPRPDLRAGGPVAAGLRLASPGGRSTAAE